MALSFLGELLHGAFGPYRKYRRTVLLPHMNFNNTQLKSANTQ